jgi:hypothetical protein
VISQPLGIPAADEAARVAVLRVVVATHGQPVKVEVEPCVFPKPAGIDGEAEVTEGTAEDAIGEAAPPTFPLTLPPIA